MPIGIVACTFSDNLSRNSCILIATSTSVNNSYLLPLNCIINFTLTVFYFILIFQINYCGGDFLFFFFRLRIVFPTKTMK